MKIFLIILCLFFFTSCIKFRDKIIISQEIDYINKDTYYVKTEVWVYFSSQIQTKHSDYDIVPYEKLDSITSVQKIEADKIKRILIIQHEKK